MGFRELLKECFNPMCNRKVVQDNEAFLEINDDSNSYFKNKSSDREKIYKYEKYHRKKYESNDDLIDSHKKNSSKLKKEIKNNSFSKKTSKNSRKKTKNSSKKLEKEEKTKTDNKKSKNKENKNKKSKEKVKYKNKDKKQKEKHCYDDIIDSYSTLKITYSDREWNKDLYNKICDYMKNPEVLDYEVY